MTATFKNYILQIVFIIVSVFGMASICGSAVVVFDRVTTVKIPIRIKVLTKSRFFSAGGRLVDIYLDNNHLKKILTGGDGYGYLKYTPQSQGFKKIEAHSDAGSSSGLILVMSKSDKAVVIDIEGAFKEAIFSDEIRENSQKAINSLSKEYKIIYLSRYVGKGVSRSWLEKEDFPKSVILRWQGPKMLAALKENGVHLYAIIGSSAVISAASEHIEKRYTFEKTKDEQTVKDWDEILKLLLPAVPAVSPENDPK
jgi:hypothetical protein